MRKLLLLISILFATFQSTEAQTVSVITPNGGEVLYACQTYNITWSQTGSPSNYWNIDYSSNGGTTWTSVASNLLITTGTFNWTIPNLQSNTVIMRLTDATNSAVTDQSNSNFTINIPVTVTAPNGGESWTAGTSQTITWNAVGTSGTFNISYSVNGGSSYSTIVSSYSTGTGTYAWTVPNNPSTFCLVRVQDASTGCMIDISNGNFTIVAATPILLTPNGGETLYMNCVYAITWNTATFYSSVSLEYSTNSGASWLPIVTASNSGSYNWTVPSTVSSTCMVRASNTADLTSFDVSNAVFAIAPSITVVSPNGGETLTGCATYTISWNKSTCIGNWTIQYSTNNGTTWTPIVTNLTNTGVTLQSYNWAVPNGVTTTQALIRVESYSSPGTYFDVSNAVFNINPNNNITVVTPNGGESWIGCSSYTITWTKLASPCNASYTLSYSLNNGTSYTNITSVTDNGLASQSYSWSVPNTLSSTQCLIKVTSGTWPTILDASNAVFTITPSADITVTSPNGGETLQGLTAQTLTWSNLAGASGLYNVEYSINNGTSWSTLATNISGNSYNWVSVPNTPSTTCLIRVTDYLNSCKFDVSNANFTISAAQPILTAPNGGQTFNVGCTTNILWTTSTFYSNVVLTYSINGGATYLPITTVTNTGSYTWTIPNTASTSCLVKAANASDLTVFDVSNAVFTIATPLTVTAANGGETWLGCSTYNISWTKSTCLGNWNLYYSTNNGSTWNSITSVTNTGVAAQTYAWQVPNGITTTQALIKVESATSPGTYSDVSDAVFNINPSNDVTVVTPNGGEVLTALTSYNITWTNLAGASGQWTLQYSTNNGASYTNIVTNITGNSYSWTVPNTSSSTCLIKVIDYVNTCKFDVSNAVFTINPSGPVLLTPNGGETLYIGCSTTITWASGTFFSTVKLEYSTNSGATWLPIIASTANTGTYTWSSVPNTVSANCLVKASNTADLTLFDVSDATFAIAPAVTVTSPNGGEALIGCTTHAITWTKTTCIGNWNLEYSTNNGTSWTSIATNVTNSGVNTQTYNWFVPNNITTVQGLIRISSTTSPATYTDVSNAVFSITPNNNITVVAPNGGEVYAGCSSYNITWTKLTSPCNASYTIAYSLNNGASYTNIATGVADNGLTSQTYAWNTIPNTLSSTLCLIKVTSNTYTNIFDESNAVFTINPSTDITVTSPNGGEIWQGLSAKTITWTNLTGASGLFNVEYSINNGTTWNTLATNISGNSYNWASVPNTPSTVCLVRVTDYLTPCKFDVSNANFTISAAQPIVTAPNGGQTFNVGCTTNITWNSTTFYSNVVLTYSIDGGTTWLPITTVTNSGSYTWTVLNTPSTNCLIKAANASDLTVFDITDAPFTISVPLTVVSANGGEAWAGCSSYAITWTKSTCVGNWNLYYSTNAGSTWNLITTVTNTGVALQSYTWAVPNTITTTQAMIKVESVTGPGTYSDVSDAVFSITPSTDITVITPNGGETIASLTSYNITWSNLPAASGQYSLSYSTNNGASYTSIVTNITGNSYSWSVPNLSSTQCLIKVTDFVNSCKFDVSNAVFTITPPTPILLTPNGGEVLYINCTYNITWNSTTFISTLNLEYSTNGGITWLPVTGGTGTPNDGTFTWTIPNTQSTNCRVRASNSVDVTIFDISDASFTISPAVQVVTPNGGEALIGCNIYAITWNKTTCVGNWNIDYSLNNGATWVNIVTNLTNTGVNSQTYNWTVPNNLTTIQGLIRVQSYSPTTYSDVSNAVFSITPNNNIVLSTPNGGETWTTCQAYNITWTKSIAPCNASYTIAYSLNNGASYTNITSVTDNGLASQTYTWTIPNTVASTTQALIKVTSNTWTTVSDVSNATFNINANADITVTAPNGGEIWQGLTTQTITWSNSIFASGLYNVYYSTNGGSTWNTIVTNYSGNSYSWSLPNTSSTTCLIKVEDNLATCRYDNSNTNFTIIPATPILLTPNGGETLNAGGSYSITWNSTTYYSNVIIYYSIDNGVTYLPIVTNSANSGAYTWTNIPNANSTTCLVKVANTADVTVFDVSNAVFTIKPAVKILTPNGGESIGGCTVTSITWERSPSWSTYKIEYSNNNGATWYVISASYAVATNPASYTWTVPNIASTQTLVRVTPTLALTYGDVSDNMFTITRPVTIIQPNLGGTMTVGSVYNITWSSDGISNLFDIYYSTNSGATFTNIVTAYNTTTNVYAWTVPNAPSVNCKIWIKDNTASCKSDTSNVNFTISTTTAPITLLTPNGGQTLTGCSPYTITWSDSPSIGTYDIQYSTNSGTTWNNIVMGYVTATQSYLWNIPNTINSATCLVRVRSTATPTILDQSDALLAINYGNLYALPSDTTVCSGQTVQLNAYNGTTYSWSPATALSCTTCSNPVATPATTTTYTVTSNSAGCILTDTARITVFTAGVSIVASSTAICAGTNVTFTATPVNGGTTPAYQWYLNGAPVGTNSPTYISSSLANGNTVYVVLTSNAACLVTTTATSSTITMNVTSIPATPGTVSGTTPVCAGTSNTYNITAVSGSTFYTWALPGGWSGTSTTTSIATTAGTVGGNITVTAGNTCGSSAAQTLPVVVNVIPSTPGAITGTSTICSGTTNTYSITAVSGATSYTWTMPGGWSGTSTTNSISATASTTSGNITVTANNSCGNSAAQTFAVVVNTTPSTPGTITGTTPICAGTINTYSVTAVAGAGSYTWTLPGGWSGTSTTNSISTTASATSGNITVTANNGCGNSAAQTLAIVVNSIPATPGTITGNTTVCQGSSNTYSITAVSGATSYTWVMPSGWSGTSATNSIISSASATSGNITITANNSCGVSAPQTLAVTVNPLPTVTAGGTATMCAGQSTALTSSGGITYSWLPTTGLNDPSIANPVASPTTTTTYTVAGTSAAGCSSTATVTITVTPGPVVTASASSSICAGMSVNLTSGGATSYSWLPTTGLSNPAISNPVATPAATTTYTVTGTTGLCSGTATTTITVNPVPTVTAGGTATICSGTATPLTSGGATTYSWLPVTGLSSATVQNPNATPTTTTTYTVTGTSAGCSATATVTITVNPSPTVSITGASSICNGSSTVITASGATSYTWLPATGLSSTTVANPTANPTVTTTYTVSGTNGTCTATATKTITVNPVPVTVATGSATICSGTSTPIAATGATSFAWLPATGLSNASIANPVASPTTTTTYTVTGTSAGCTSTATVTITVNPAPTASAGTPVTICAGSNTTLNATGGVTYSWLPSGTLSNAAIANPVATPTTTTTYTVTVGNGTCTATSTVTVTVTPAPVANAGPNVTVACGASTTLNASGGTSYSWSPATGLSSTTISNPVSTPPYTITYTVTVTSGGCTSTDAVLVTSGTMTANAGADVTICAPGSTTLSGSSTGGGGGTYVNLATSHTYTQSVGTYTAITGGTVFLNNASASMDDIVSTSITIPTFKFNNINYTNIFISTNGFITFGATAPSTTNYDPIGSTETYAGAVAGFGTDLNKATTGTPEIRYQTIGTEFIVQYRDMGRYSGTGTTDRLSFQIRLNTVGNTVKVVYDAPALVGAATFDPEVGLRGPNNTFTTNVHNRLVLSTTGPWVGSTQGTTNTSVCFIDSSVPATKPAAGTTFLWTPVTAATTTYSWSPATGLSSTTIVNPVASPTVTTTYTLTATSGSCAAIDQVTVTVLSAAGTSAGPDATICAGTSTPLSATGGGTYSWSPATGLSSTTIANPVATPTVTTTYTVTVSSGTCTYTDAVTITVTPLPVANAGSDVAVCAGSSATLNATGGTTYSWFPATGLSSTTIANPVATPATTTTYTVTVGNGSCTSTDIVVVTVNPVTVANAGSDVTICSGSSTTLTATGGTTYSWLPATGLSSTTIANPVATPTATTTYTVTVTNGSCTATDVVLVTVNTVTANAGTDATICSGSSTTLSATGGTSYAWSPATGLSSTTIANPVATPTSTTTYTLVATTGSCSATDLVTVTVNSAPVAPASISGSATVCEGSTQTYSVASDPNISSYSWVLPSGWSGASSTNSINATAGANSGVIMVTASNSCGSASPVTFNVTVNPLPVVTVSSFGIVCVAASPFTLSGGTPTGGTYSGTGVSGGTTFTPATAGAGTFPIVYTYSDGTCSNTATDNIIVDLCTSVADATASNEVKVYPNPFRDFTIISIGTGTDLNGTEIHIYDMLGKEVIIISDLQTHEVRVDRNELRDGMYFFQVINVPTATEIGKGKLIIE
jgi:hypothetical protein